MPLNVLLGKIGDAIVRRTDPTSAKYPVRTLLVAIVVFISAFLTAAQMHRLGWLPPLSQMLSDLGWSRAEPERPAVEGEK